MEAGYQNLELSLPSRNLLSPSAKQTPGLCDEALSQETWIVLALFGHLVNYHLFSILNVVINKSEVLVVDMLTG